MKEQITNETLRRYVHGELDWREAVKVRAAIHSDSEIAQTYRAYKKTEFLLQEAYKNEKYRPTAAWYSAMALAACLLIMFGWHFTHPSYDIHWEQDVMRNESTADKTDSLERLVHQELRERLKDFPLRERKAWAHQLSAQKLKILDVSTTSSMKHFEIEFWDGESESWVNVVEFDSKEDMQKIAERLADLLFQKSKSKSGSGSK